MLEPFFTFKSYREFLKSRYDYLKQSQPKFSARYAARRARIGSPSYFNLVFKGKRQLSLEYAQKFAVALSLSDFERECLLASVSAASAKDQRSRLDFIKKLSQLERQSSLPATMLPTHVKILSDIFNLKLYLLAQCADFRFSNLWIKARFDVDISEEDLQKRINILIDSGLWKNEHGRIKTIAPSISTGDCLQELNLIHTHENILKAAKGALTSQSSDQRVITGQTFLCDPKSVTAIKKKIDDFKQKLETEFECLGSDRVFQFEMAFFELKP